jgi:hypothetical protein
VIDAWRTGLLSSAGARMGLFLLRAAAVKFRKKQETTRFLSLQPYIGMIMYIVTRCPGCQAFTYMDRFQRFKLCHICGEVIDITRAPEYLEVSDHQDAEHIIKQLEFFLKKTGRPDLSKQELEKLRIQYAEWLRSRL